MSIRLKDANLSALPDEVDRPNYNRQKLSPGIVHIGVGNFHRAHQAFYLHKLFQQGFDHDWAIVGAGLRPADEKMRATLGAQDWLTTVVETDSSGESASVCGAMIDLIKIDNEVLIDTLTQRNIRIVSLTITEGGYYLDAVSGGFDANHEEIVHDAANIDKSKTVFGVLLAALLRRRVADIEPFTILSCDNIPENGRVTRAGVVGLAECIGTEIADWVRKSVTFPNSMVDCITPATSERERNLLNKNFGIDDGSPVFCEPFRQWVLEDNFPAGRPALEKVGVELVTDVMPYERMKLRILNGGHAAIAYAAALMNIEYVYAAMANPLLKGFLDKLEYREIIPMVPRIPGVNFDQYYRQVAKRFSNVKIADTIVRLCEDGSNRQPKFILPATIDRLKHGLDISGLALVSAMWCRYCAGVDEHDTAIEIRDQRAEKLTELALIARQNPSEFLAMRQVFGVLSDSPVFEKQFAAALDSLWRNGVEVTLQAYIDA